ncbi:hypothetical protein Dsin_007632 [Dipteronia sinensis]|uniref:Uncharacterized protein n=1 Tax=Dipteronia sinensis TaxID=43782 RepID=A0AAE0EIL5_9ROSI|nr:hypothetical protein Dsin_007632 [Dipteronia sinensis]
MYFISQALELHHHYLHPPPHHHHHCPMGRPPCCDKSNVKRGLWTPEEDAKILAYVSDHGTGNWTLVPKKAGLNRCGKSCRLRWTNYLRPDLKHDSFTPEEEEHIINLHKAIGSSTITQLSSTVQQQPQIITTPSSPFSWSEFLLCDPIPSQDFPQEPDDDQGLLSSTNSSSLAENETNGCQINSTNEQIFDNNIGSDDQAINNKHAEASSSSGSSFVDAILCQDSEMSSKLFELLDTSFD